MSILPQSQLDTIRERAEAATQGPWFVGSWSGQCHLNHRHGNGDCKYEYTKIDYEGRCVSVDSDQHIELIGYDDYGPVLNAKTAEFIAHSRTDIPDLLGHITSLERRLAIAETAIVDLLDKSADSIDTDEYPGLVQAVAQIRQGRDSG